MPDSTEDFSWHTMPSTYISRVTVPLLLRPSLDQLAPLLCLVLDCELLEQGTILFCCWKAVYCIIFYNNEGGKGVKHKSCWLNTVLGNSLSDLHDNWVLSAAFRSFGKERPKEISKGKEHYEEGTSQELERNITEVLGLTFQQLCGWVSNSLVEVPCWNCGLHILDPLSLGSVIYWKYHQDLHIFSSNICS